MCPAPGISHPIAGASTAIVLTGAASATFALLVEFAILDNHNLALNFSRHFRRLGAHQDVDLAAHAKLRQINAGLDREAGVGKNLPLVMNLEVVHVGSVSMNIGADGMSGAMNEIVAVPGLLNVSPCSPVDFPSRDAASRADRVKHGLHSRVARIPHDGKNLLHAFRRR